ncbi:MAG TPA: hypothetical protein PLV68_15985, partial [Ilumatobacteraceae bacterium]|nr:hypothetical protein [Ilumatobacteraceae bacterium]
RALLGDIGGFVLLLAIGVGGLLLVTNLTIRSLLARTGQGVGQLARPLGQAARRKIGDLSTLRSDRDDTLALDPAPQVYDAEAEEDFSAPKPARSRKPRALPTPDPLLAEHEV